MAYTVASRLERLPAALQVLAANGNRGPSTPTQSARQNGQSAHDTFGAKSTLR